MQSTYNLSRHKVDRKEDQFAAIAIAVCFYLLLLYLALLEPSSLAMWDKALGPMPYGVGQKLFVFFWVTGLCLPLPYGFYHAVVTVRFTRQAVDKKSSLDDAVNVALPVKALFEYLHYLVSNSDVPASIKKSKLVTLSLILYLIGIAIAWILWAESKGI